MAAGPGGESSCAGCCRRPRGRGRAGRPVHGGRGDPTGVHEDRVADQLHGAGLRPALLRRRHGRRSRAGTASRSTSRSRSRPRRPRAPTARTRCRHLPRLGRHEAQPRRRRRAARADPRLRRVHDDRPRLGPVVRPAPSRADPRCASKGYIRLMHNAYEVRDAQYLLGQLADDGVIEPQKIGATGGSYGGGISIALGALRNRTQLPNGALVPWTSPLGKPMRDRRHVPEFTWSDLADGAEPERQLARLRRRRAVPRRRPPRSASRSRAGTPRSTSAAWRSGYYAPVGHRSVRRHHRLEGADRHRRPVRRQPGGRRRWSPSSPPTTRRYYIDDSHRARARAAGQRLERRPVPGRRVAPLLQQGPREAPERADLDVPPRLRPQPARGRGLRGRPRGADGGRERVARLLRQGRRAEPADARGGVDILTSKCPVNSAGTRYHAPTWAQLAPGEIRVDGAAAQTIVAPGTAAVERVHRPATSARPRRAPTTRRPRPTASRRRRRRTRSRARRRSSPSSPSTAPTTWSRRGCTTSTARPSG